MKRFLKFALIISAFVLSLALAGCGDISIDGGITAENTVSLKYTLAFNDLDRDSDNYTELKDYLDELKDNWEDMDFESKLVKEDNSLILECTMSQECESREQAFEALYGFMTNEISVFDNVEYSYVQGFYQEDYTISGKIDISDIVDSSITSKYPAHIMSSIDEFYKNSTFEISFSLPYNDSDTTGEVVQKAFSKEVSFDNQTEFEFTGIIKNFENAEHERQINSEKADYEKKILISAIASAVLLIALLVIIILKVKKGKKQKEEGEEPVKLTAEEKAQKKEEAKAAKAKAKEEKAKAKEEGEEPVKLTAEEKAQKKEEAKAAKAKAKEEKAKAKEEANAAKAKAKEEKAKAEAEAEKAKAEAEKAAAEEKTEE
ncbi:MAG: hypothetical protein AB1Z23_10970 [Eubacteriales bacterium]